MDYPYENLSPEKFQEFCQSLLVNEYPEIQCLPVGQPDGGRDAFFYYQKGRGDTQRNFIIFQVKFVREKYSQKDLYLWLEEIINKEKPKIDKLKDHGAKRYILITNLSGTAHLESGTIDKVNNLLNGLDIDANCWWRDDLNRRLDNAWNVKWVYQELMTGPDLIRAITESDLSENKERRSLALKAYIQDQYSRDEDVRFKQVDLQHKLLDLFIDLPILPPNDSRPQKKRRSSENLYQAINYIQRHKEDNSNIIISDDLLPFIERDESAFSSREFLYRFSHREDTYIGAATLLLDSAIHELAPHIVLEGAPGQGKSTITQYICQAHRMRLLGKENLINTLPKQHAQSPIKLPFRVDLRDYATWLTKTDPFSPTREEVQSPYWNKSLESFLAAQVRYHSGGIDFTQSDLASVLKFSSILLVLDGLDEVVDIERRRDVVNEIILGINRLEINAASLQTVITSRPAVFANSPGLPENKFPYFQLGVVQRTLIDEYTDKWLHARGLRGREGSEIKGILKSKLDQPHIRELAKNPMQLAILLSLVHTRGTSLPDKRTALYGNYVDLFFNREAEKNSIVRDYRDLLINIHCYLAWTLQTEAEMGNNNSGSITEVHLHSLLHDYLLAEGYDPSLSSILFTGMIERVVALVSRVQGTYEFEVQPLREYFAARYLYETAPYSPPGNEKRGALPDRFIAIARDFYWLNVTRFYAGCYSKGELPSLIECLKDLIKEDGYDSISHPRILAATLLSDWVFTQHPKSVQEVIKIVMGGIGLRYILASDSRRLGRGSSLILPKGCGKDELVQYCFQELAKFYPRDYALDIIGLINSNATANEIEDSWLSMVPKDNIKEKTQWIEYGLYLGCLARIKTEDFLQLLQDVETRTVINIVFRSKRFDYFEASDKNITLAIQAILRRETMYLLNDTNQHIKNNFETFDQALTAGRYAMAFNHAYDQMPLFELWKQGTWVGYTKVQALDLSWEEEKFASKHTEYAKCRNFINLVLKNSNRTVEDWSTTIGPWDNIVEYGRQLWGEQWAFNQLANISGGIKSSTETCKDFPELLDHSVSLCKRARYARLRAGTIPWWKKQLENAASAEDKALVSLIFSTWVSSTTFIKLIELLDQTVCAFEYYTWGRLYLAVREIMSFIQFTNDRKIDIDIKSLPANISERGILLLSLRIKDKSRLYLEYLKNYTGNDKFVLDFCQQEIFDLVATRKIDWQFALKTIELSYQKGLIQKGYPHRIYEGNNIETELPDEIAKEILSRPESFPGFLISLAEGKYRAKVAKSIIPVGEVSLRERWFDN
ncbi:MAG: NTPase (NACHT family)-like protein [Chloroflexi bacterium]|nr:NTPase (NACHT family)-like protein [Chloroflexota bacterium]